MALQNGNKYGKKFDYGSKKIEKNWMWASKIEIPISGASAEVSVPPNFVWGEPNNPKTWYEMLKLYIWSSVLPRSTQIL